MDAAGSEDMQASAADLDTLRVSLRESEERFRLLVETVTDYAIFLLTPEGRVATNDDYKRAVFNDLSRGPNG